MSTSSTSQEQGPEELTTGKLVAIFMVVIVFGVAIVLVVRAFASYVQTAMNYERNAAARTTLLLTPDTSDNLVVEEVEEPAESASHPGEAVFIATGCTACHTFDGTELVGPSLQGISDRAGDTLPGMSAEEYLYDSILNPCDHLIEGYDCLMPQNYDDVMTEDDLNDLVAYLLEQ